LENVYDQLEKLSGRSAIIKDVTPEQAQRYLKVRLAYEKAMESAAREIQRVQGLQKLPIEFWRIMRRGQAKFLLVTLESNPDATTEDKDFAHAILRLLDRYGHDQVVKVDLDNLPTRYAQTAFDRLSTIASGAECIHRDGPGHTHTAYLAPVSSFPDFVAAADIGTIMVENVTARHLKVQVDRRTVGGKANTDAEEARIEREERERERLAEAARREAEEREREKHRQEEREKQEARFAQHGRHLDELDPNDPNYHEKLTDRMLSDDWSTQRKALAAMMAIRPEEVKSAETRKKIARAFGTLARNARFSERDKAVRGLVRWSGRFSIPILIELFEGDRFGFHNRTVLYQAFGELKDPRVIPTVASRLGTHFEHDDAYRVLQKIGAAGEDEFLKLAPSPNPAVCLAAVTLLGEFGTEKCIPTLRRAATKSPNPMVKQAAKFSIRQIRARASGAEEVNKDDEKKSD
jgi:hypothetical protein